MSIQQNAQKMKLPAAPQAGSPLCSDKLQGILAKASKTSERGVNKREG